MSSEVKHTPLPWKISRYGIGFEIEGVVDGEPHVIAQTQQLRGTDRDEGHWERKANTEFIVTAVNNYATLERQLSDLRAALEEKIRKEGAFNHGCKLIALYSILAAEGLADWKIKIAADPYCWIEMKTIQIPDDASMGLFLHEVAHALYPEPEGEKKNHYHGGNWASIYGTLIDKYMRFNDSLDR